MHGDPVLAAALSVALALGLSVATLLAVARIDFPGGIERVLWNLGTRGILFFTLGFVFSSQLMTPRKGSLSGALAGLAVWALCYYILKQAGMASNGYRLVSSLVATFAALHALQVLLARMPRLAGWLAGLGQRSLHLFLLHQVFVALAYLALHPLIGWLPGIAILALMFLSVKVCAAVSARILTLVPGNPFFAVPPGLADRLTRMSRA